MAVLRAPTKSLYRLFPPHFDPDRKASV